MGGTITAAINYIFRDRSADGVFSSGLHDVKKADVRTLGPLFEEKIANAALGALVDVLSTTQALLDLNLAYDAGTVAWVHADDDDANNDLYLKSGASGTGAWTNTNALHDLAAGLIADAVATVEAARDQAVAAAAGFGEMLKPLYDFAATDRAEVFTRGDHTVGSSTISASLKGWRSAFKHDGSAFQAVELSVRAGAAETRGQYRILDEDKEEIARGHALAGTGVSTVLVALNKMVRELAEGAIGWIEYQPTEAGGVLGYPAGGAYDAEDADPEVYQEQYLGADDEWHDATPAGSYRIQFRALNFTGALGKGSLDALWALAVGQEAVTYDRPGYTEFDAVYTAAGVGQQMPAQNQQVRFNTVTVYGGMAGDGRLRLYLVDPATPHAHTPSEDDELLAEKLVTWTNEVIARPEVFAALLAVPVGRKLHALWVANSGNASVARHTSNVDGVLPRIRFTTSGAGDEEGIWDEEWSDGIDLYSTVPLKLSVTPAASIASAEPPFFTIPAVIDAVVDNELPLYHDSICSAPSNGLAGLVGYTCSITGPKGRNEQRLFRWTPQEGDEGDHVFTARLWQGKTVVATRQFTVRVIAATPLGSAETMLDVGDSLGATGRITAATQAKFVALGGTVPTFVGTQGTDPAKHECYGGRTYAYFAGPGGVAYEFTVSGVVALVVNAIYEVGGIEYRVFGFNITGGAGTIQTTGDSAPPASGTLTKVSTHGADATISFSASETTPGNPFWNDETEELDPGAYRADNSIDAPLSRLGTMLGTNEGANQTLLATAEIDAIIDDAKAWVDSWIADATERVRLDLPPLCCNTSDGFAANYGAGYSREVVESNLFRIRRAMLETFDEGAYHAQVKIGAAGLVLDRYYGFERTARPASASVAYTVAEVYADQVADLSPEDGELFYCDDADVYIAKVGATTKGGYRLADKRDGILEVHGNALHPYPPGDNQMGAQRFAEDLAWLS